MRILIFFSSSLVFIMAFMRCFACPSEKSGKSGPLTLYLISKQDKGNGRRQKCHQTKTTGIICRTINKVEENRYTMLDNGHWGKDGRTVSKSDLDAMDKVNTYWQSVEYKENRNAAPWLSAALMLVEITPRVRPEGRNLILWKNEYRKPYVKQVIKNLSSEGIGAKCYSKIHHQSTHYL